MFLLLRLMQILNVKIILGDYLKRRNEQKLRFHIVRASVLVVRQLLFDE